MNQITDINQPKLNEPMIMQMNPNVPLLGQPNIPPMINNHHSFPINPKGVNPLAVNTPQNEDTSKNNYIF